MTVEGAVDSAALTGRVVQFARVLRGAGMRVGSSEIIDAVSAVASLGVDRRRAFRDALGATLVKRRDDRELFNVAFRWCFGEASAPGPAGRGQEQDAWQEATQPSGLRRLLESLSQPSAREHSHTDNHETTPAGSATQREILQRKDIAQMSAEELREARSLMARSWRWDRLVPTRRWAISHCGRRPDLRRTLRLAAKTGGEPMALPQQAPRKRPPSFVVLCDISGSMAAYSRVYLYFAHLLTTRYSRVETFTFGTSLTRVTRELRGHDVDVAMASCAQRVKDWDGGTRISGALRTFNQQWLRRVMSGQTHVLLFTDGLERGSLTTLDGESARLQRNTRSLIWLNPLLRYDDFEPAAKGIRCLLANVDRLIPGHSLEGLSQIADAVDGR